MSAIHITEPDHPKNVLCKRKVRGRITRAQAKQLLESERVRIRRGRPALCRDCVRRAR